MEERRLSEDHSTLTAAHVGTLRKVNGQSDPKTPAYLPAATESGPVQLGSATCTDPAGATASRAPQASPRQELKSAREVDSPPGAAFGAVPLPQHGAYAPVLPGVPEGSSAQRTTTFADFDGAAAYLLAAAQMRPAVPPLWDADVGASALVARSISASPGPGKANSASGASPRGPIGWDCSPDVASHDDIEARTAVADVTRRRSHGGIVSGGGVASAQGVAEVGGRKDGAARRVAEALKSREASRHCIAERRRRQEINRQMEALRGCVPGSERLDKASLIEAAISHIQRLAAQVKTLEDRLAALELMSLSARPPSRSGQEKAASGHPG